MNTLLDVRRSVIALAATLSLGSALACGGRGDAAVSPRQSVRDSTLTINLTTPNADDGAMLLTITGPSILALTARPGIELAETRAMADGQTTSTILVRGNLASGAIGEMTVRAVDAGAIYVVEPRQVAAGASGGYALRTNLTGYRVTLQR